MHFWCNKESANIIIKCIFGLKNIMHNVHYENLYNALYMKDLNFKNNKSF